MVFGKQILIIQFINKLFVMKISKNCTEIWKVQIKLNNIVEHNLAHLEMIKKKNS